MSKSNFVLLVGNHSVTDKNGKVRKYTKGEIIESEHNLIKLFKNKFARAGDEDKTLPESELAKELEEELEEASQEEVVVPLLELKMISRGKWTIINEDGDEVIDTHIPKAEAQVLLDELTG